MSSFLTGLGLTLMLQFVDQAAVYIDLVVLCTPLSNDWYMLCGCSITTMLGLGDDSKLYTNQPR